ncbi:MAG TPA: AarF/ABC1/UbiB kinase family protein [Chloroflexi bacterium]|nr:AarF/ABC1/UbiB kinase family protein [Chloroflexota bacterium]
MLRRRYRRITSFFARALLGLFFWEVILPRLGLRFLSNRTRDRRLVHLARRYRTLAVSMGGVLIKVGQFLSARVDILPDIFTRELENLQDEVPPEDFAAVREVAEREFGRPLEAVFPEFDPHPLAAASIGQAHYAWIAVPPGESAGADSLEGAAASGEAAPPQRESVPPSRVRVVVKIQRPNIEELVATDLSALERVGGWLMWYGPIRQRANIPALLDDFSHSLHEEMDYLQEGKYAEQFAADFAEEPRLLIPKVYWEYTTRRVITLEDVGGIKITDFEAIEAANVSRRAVADLLFESYLRQVFLHHFFHADPHPGNLFVVPLEENGAAGRAFRLAFVDFGMMGHVPPEQREGLRQMAIAITTRDAARAVRAYQMLGFLLPNADLELIEQAGVQIFERFWGKSTQELRQIDFREVREFISEFRALLYTLPFQLPENMILLGRAASILSGMCTALNPEFNPWWSLIPFTQLLIEEERKSGWEGLKQELRSFEQELVRLPGRLDALLRQVEEGKLRTRNPELTRQVARLERSAARLTAAIVFAAALLGGIQLYLAGFSAVSAVLLILALAALWRALRG